MAYNTLTYVEGVVRCEDLEAMLFAASATMQLRIRLDTIPEEEDYVINRNNPYYMDYSDDYDQDYEDYLDRLDYIEQSYD